MFNGLGNTHLKSMNPKRLLYIIAFYLGTSQAPVNIRCGRYLYVDKPMVTKSELSTTNVDVSKMETEGGDRLTSQPMVIILQKCT